MANVLVVDDDQKITRALLRVLRGRHDVRVAQTADEALAAIEEHVPDAVICDYLLGPVTATELLRKVRAGWPKIRIVLHSGSRPDSWDALVKEGLVDTVLLKPSSIEEILASLGV